MLTLKQIDEHTVLVLEEGYVRVHVYDCEETDKVVITTYGPCPYSIEVGTEAFAVSVNNDDELIKILALWRNVVIKEE